MDWEGAHEAAMTENMEGTETEDTGDYGEVDENDD